MLFADDAAVVTHTQEELQSLMNCFSYACKGFRLTISLKKTNVLGQDTAAPPVITINDYELDAVCQFTYLRDIKAVDNNTMSWEGLAADRTGWRSVLKQHLKTGEDKLMTAAAESVHTERRAAAPSDPRPHIDVVSATKTATAVLACSATSDAATTQPENNKIKNKNRNIRMYHPRSSLTDGGLYVSYEFDMD